MAGPAASRVASLVLRIIALLLLLISLIVLATSTQTIDVINGQVKVGFNDIKAYRYMLSSIVIGFVIVVVHTVLSIYQVIVKGDGFLTLDFYADKFVSYLLATGMAAGFGVTVDMKLFFDGQGLEFTTFYDKVYASASLLLLAFVCTAASSVLSSYALPKRI